MAIIQWVNLERADFDEYNKADPKISSKDRCGKLSIKTAFERGKVPLQYKVKVQPVGDGNILYDATELAPGRNFNFKMTKGKTDLGTETEVKMKAEINLPAAGGNKYKLVAQDENGKEVASEEVEVKRKMFYQYIYMDDASGKVTPYSLQPLEEHCLKHHIDLSKVGADKKIPFIKTIKLNDSKSFETEVRKAYDMPGALKSVGCAAVLSNYISASESFSLEGIIALGKPKNPFCVVTATTITILGDVGSQDYLWYGLNDADDNAKAWFVSGEIEYSGVTPAPGSAATPIAPARLAIDSKDVEVGSVKKFTYGGIKDVVIKIQPPLQVLLNNTDGTIKIKLVLLKASGFYNGFAVGGGITTSATKVRWEDRDVPGALNTWKHEFGHRIGMVAYGDKKNSAHGNFHSNPKGILPNAPPTLYGEQHKINGKEHQGPHCEKGATFNAATRKWSGTPQCIMFGSSGTSTADRLPDYCDECAKIVRKLDLSADALKG